MVTQAQANSFVQNPVDFLKMNVVRYAGKRFTAPNMGMTFVLRDNINVGRRRNAVGLKVNATSMLIYEDDPCWAAEAPPTFQAVWGGYVAGGQQTVPLPAVGGPDIMLTPQLDGCTVAAKVANDGSAEFSHYNYSQGGQTMDKATMVGAALNQHGGGVNTFSKEDYRGMAKGDSPVAMSVTVVGFRTHGVWSFWGQLLENKISGMQIRGVRKLG